MQTSTNRIRSNRAIKEARLVTAPGLTGDHHQEEEVAVDPGPAAGPEVIPTAVIQTMTGAGQVEAALTRGRIRGRGQGHGAATEAASLNGPDPFPGGKDRHRSWTEGE